MTSGGRGDVRKVERKCKYMFECANIKLQEDEKREKSRQRGSKVGRQGEGKVDGLDIEGKQGKGYLQLFSFCLTILSILFFFGIENPSTRHTEYC